MNNYDQTIKYVKQLKQAYEIRNMSFIRFLKMRIIRNFDQNTLSLMQNNYMNKLIKNYQIDIIMKALSTPLLKNLEKFMKKIDFIKIHEYRKKIKSICYLIVIIKLDIIKTAFKLSKFFINSKFDHLIAANQCFRYLSATKYLKIKYFVSTIEGYLSVKMFDQSHQIFEIMIDVSFDNFFDKKNEKRYAFRLYDDLIN